MDEDKVLKDIQWIVDQIIDMNISLEHLKYRVDNMERVEDTDDGK